MSRVLEVAEVTKQYEKVKAVDELSFDVKRGEVFALLGPNGAGKTTMVRMLLGIIYADSGKIKFSLGNLSDGRPSPSDLGYLPEDRGLYLDQPIFKTLRYFGRLRGLTAEAAAASTEDWLERMGLDERRGDKLETLSKGNQQKVQFISSILHEPSFAIFDEPFSGLDPVNQDVILDIIRELRDKGVTVLLSAHQMQLVERIADRILLMNDGRQVLQGTLKEIRTELQSESKITLKIMGEPNLTELKSQPAIEDARLTEDGDVALYLRKGQSLSDLLVSVGSSLQIIEVHSERVSLHDIYVQAVDASKKKE